MSKQNTPDEKAALIAQYTQANYTLFPCQPFDFVKKHNRKRQNALKTLKNGEALPDDLRLPKTGKEGRPGWNAWEFDADGLDKTKSLILFKDIFGVLLTEEDIIVDIDPRNFPDGQDSLQNLELETGVDFDRTDTFVVQTPTGGLHYYFKKPAEVRLKSAPLRAFPGIDIKTKGGYVCGAGSPTPIGEQFKSGYLPKQNDPTQVKTLPPKLLAFLEQHHAAPVRSAQLSGVGAIDDEYAITEYIQYLQVASTEIPAYQVAARGHDLGVSEQVCFDLMWEYYAPRCTPWEPDALKSRVHNAYKYAQNAAGSSHPSAVFADVQVPVKASNVNFASSDDLATDSPADVQADFSEEDQPEDPDEIVWSCNPRTGELLHNAQNITNYMKLMAPIKGLVYKDLFRHRIYFRKKPPWRKIQAAEEWQEDDTRNLQTYITLRSENHFHDNHLAHYLTAVQRIADIYARNPVTDFLNSLKWDGVARLDRLFIDYAGAKDTEYVRAVGAKTLIGAVARAFQPGCKFDNIIVLEGRQGTGKSTFVSVLGGDHYASLVIDPHSKETVENMLGCWIIEVGEMEFVKRVEANAFKIFCAKQIDRIRQPYARLSQNIPRSSIFIGTINPDLFGYLSDPTGNRRYWPIETTKIEIDKLKQDRDQLFAEAVHRYRAGEPFHFDDIKLVRAAEKEQEKREEEEPYTDSVLAWLSKKEQELQELRKQHPDKEFPDLEVRISEVAEYALTMSPGQLTKAVRNRIARALKLAGFKNVDRWDGVLKKSYKIWIREDQQEETGDGPPPTTLNLPCPI